MKIMVDTNVLISAIVFHGRPRELLVRLMENGHDLFVSSYIDAEFRRKIQQKWPTKAKDVFTVYQSIGFKKVESVQEQYAELRDINDVPILSDAIHYKMDVILTGDKDFLDAGLTHPKALSVPMMFDSLDW